MLWFGHQWNGERSEWGKELEGCSLHSQNVSSLWLDVEETAASSDGIGCNFKPFKGQTFMTATTNDQFCDPPATSIYKMNNRFFV